MIITFMSVLVALVVGGIEVPGLAASVVRLRIERLAGAYNGRAELWGGHQHGRL
jgi:high-affinity nickel permease